MNYLFYRRIKGPVFLLTFGVTALLAEWDILSFSRSWPLYLIVWGVLRLAEGAALNALPPAAPYIGQAPAPGYGPGYAPVPAAGAEPGTGLTTVAPAYMEPAAGHTPLPEEKR